MTSSAIFGRWREALEARRLMDRLRVSDPGLQRFKNAGRTTVAVAVTVLIASILIGQKSQSAPLFGAVVGLMGLLMVNDPEPEQQKVTTALLFVPAALSATLGALLAPVTWLSDAGLILIIFLAFYLRQFGPRYVAIGMMAVIPFFFSSILGFKLAQLPWLFAASAIGVACAYLFRFVLLPDRPGRILRRSVSTFHVQLGMTLDSTIRIMEDGTGGEGADKKILREVRRLNGCATTAESQPAAPNFEGSEEESSRLRLYLFDAELSAHTLSRVVRRLADSTDDTPQVVRDSLLNALRALSTPLRDGVNPAGSESVSEALAALRHSREQSSGGRKPEAWTFRARRAEAAVRQLLEGAGEEQELQETFEDSEEEEDQEPEESESGSLVERLKPTTIQGIQAALAASLAEVTGTLLFPSRSYWAVITAFVVFARTRSVGETFARGLERTAGTLLGVVAGFFLATAASGDLYLEIALIFVCIFMAFYLFPMSYALMVFWITAMLALLYGLLGRFSGHILEVRLVDTLVGAAIGLAVSVLVLPARTSDEIKDGAADFLDSFGDYVRGCVERLAGGTRSKRPLDEMRELDGKLRDINQSATTVKRESTMFGRSATELDHLMTALMAMNHYARRLAAPSVSRVLLDGRQRSLLNEIGERIATNVDALCTAITNGKEPDVRGAGGLFERLEEVFGERAASGEGDPTGSSIPDERPGYPMITASEPGQEDALRALYYLRRINRAVMDLSTKMGGKKEEQALPPER